MSGNSINIEGQLTLNKPLAPEYKAYLHRYLEVAHQAWDETKIAIYPDPVREAAGLSLGPYGICFTGIREQPRYVGEKPDYDYLPDEDLVALRFNRSAHPGGSFLQPEICEEARVIQAQHWPPSLYTSWRLTADGQGLILPGTDLGSSTGAKDYLDIWGVPLYTFPLLQSGKD